MSCQNNKTTASHLIRRPAASPTLYASPSTIVSHELGRYSMAYFSGTERVRYLQSHNLRVTSNKIRQASIHNTAVHLFAIYMSPSYIYAFAATLESHV
jgi:hypothetical protein